MEARSKSGNNATQNFTIHTSYGIEWHIAMAKKINQPPMLLTKIEPWIVEVAFPKQEATNSTEGSDGQEIVEQTLTTKPASWLAFYPQVSTTKGNHKCLEK